MEVLGAAYGSPAGGFSGLWMWHGNGHMPGLGHVHLLTARTHEVCGEGFPGERPQHVLAGVKASGWNAEAAAGRRWTVETRAIFLGVACGGPAHTCINLFVHGCRWGRSQ